VPPALLLFEGDWGRYQRQLSDVFSRELSNGNPVFRGIRVSCQRRPETDGEWFAFWHLISEGHVEDERIPDMRRCERLPWVRWIIDHADNDNEIDVWEYQNRRAKNIYLWYREEYLVVLSRRNGYFLLKTAFCTPQDGYKRKLRRQRDNAI